VTPLDDPELVRAQYEREENLRARQSIYGDAEGVDPRELAFEAVAEISPGRILEVGGGQGELAERMARELGTDLEFVDQSARMVELARGRGLDARVGDAQALPFPDGDFDVAVAAWMLYHVADVDRAVGELARVLRPGGRLVAVTNGAGHLAELRARSASDGRTEDGWWGNRSFSSENGGKVLARHFAGVERRDADGWVTIRHDGAIWAYLRSLSAVEPPDELPQHDLPLRVRCRSSVFVATK
jgi:SAM-dependent methyltransferase